MPKQLQSDFQIVPKYENDKVEFETKAITEDAYEKFPMKINYTMKFNNADEAKKFRETGFSDLLKEANRLQKPIEVPNIINMRELLGDYEDPLGYANKYGSEGIKLYICPTPPPKAEKYKIEFLSSYTSLNIETNLRVNRKYSDKIILTNEDSKDEPYNIQLSLTNITQCENDKYYKGKFRITISLRDEYKLNCEYNKELIKYRFLIEDSTCNIIINKIETQENLFNFYNCGTTSYRKKDYINYDRILKLIDMVIYISKVKQIHIDYDLDSFIRNEHLIMLLYSEINNKNCKIKKKMFFDMVLSKNSETEKTCNQKMTANLEYIILFDKKFLLKDNEVTLSNISIVGVEEENDIYKVKIESSNIDFKILKNKKSNKS